MEATLRHLAERGPVAVQPKEVCAELGLSKALVNYHFEGRNGLIGEAMALGYERYVDALWAAADAAGDDPIERLFAWIDRQIEWTSANVGLAAALDFPSVAGTGSSSIPPAVRDRLQVAGARNFDNLQRLVTAAKQTLPGSDHGPTRSMLDAAVIGWSTLGVAIWLAGDHLPTQDHAGRGAFEAARQHLRVVVRGVLAG